MAYYSWINTVIVYIKAANSKMYKELVWNSFDNNNTKNLFTVIVIAVPKTVSNLTALLKTAISFYWKYRRGN